MSKSPDAFRTISEVADWLGVQAHVLRFWESKFAQVKPIKRAGGRRYYRPADMLLIGGIKKLLHDDGLTIKGAQKILREQGVAHVADLSQPLDDLTMAVIEGSIEPALAAPRQTTEKEPPVAPAALDGEVMAEDADDWSPEDLVNRHRDREEEEAASEALSEEYSGRQTGHKPRQKLADDTIEDAVLEREPDEIAQGVEAEAPSDEAFPIDEPQAELTARDAGSDSGTQPDFHASDEDAADSAIEDQDALPGFLRHPLKTGADEPSPDQEEPQEAGTAADAQVNTGAAENEAVPDDIMPSFSARPRGRSPQSDVTPPIATPPDTPQAAAPADAEVAHAETRKPRIIDLPPLPDEADMPAAPSALSALTQRPSFDADQARALRPLLARLIRHRASLASPRKEARKD